jgi:menaquinone-9 beta-reductase
LEQENNIIETPVLIAGGGPGGLTASIFLSKIGIHHVLVEKQTYPRDKVCGDALSGKVMSVIRRMEPGLENNLASHSDKFLGSHGVIFYSPNGKKIEVPFRTSQNTNSIPPGFVGKRTDFDDWLFSKLNPIYSTVFQNATIDSIERNDAKIKITTTHNDSVIKIYPKIVIGADGARSVTARDLGSYIPDRKHSAAGIRAYYTGVTGLSTEGFIELHFNRKTLPGYLWIFPMPGGMANVGLGMPSAEVSSKKINLRNLLENILCVDENLKKRFSGARKLSAPVGWTLPLGTKKFPISGDRFMLCGDAAHLIDPFTGEGISHAMISGMKAAQQAKKSLTVNRFDADFMYEYDKDVYNRLWKELKMSHTMQKLSQHPWLLNMVVGKAAKSKRLQETLMCMFEDLDLRKQLTKPSFYLDILFNR